MKFQLGTTWHTLNVRKRHDIKKNFLLKIKPYVGIVCRVDIQTYGV